MPRQDDADRLILTLKRVAYVLDKAEVPFALAGGFAVYARGGTSSDHDVDFLIREADVGKALDSLVAAGFRAERPPEGWLVKSWDDDRLVDLIYRPVERPVTDETLAHTEVLPVSGIHVPVLDATELMIHKLLSFSQHHCDFAKALPVARSLREQIKWDVVAEQSRHSPYARAFFVLLTELRVIHEGVAV